MFPGVGVLTLIQMIFCRLFLHQNNDVVPMAIFDARFKIGPLQPGPNFNPKVRDAGDQVQADGSDSDPDDNPPPPPDDDEASNAESTDSSESDSEDEDESDGDGGISEADVAMDDVNLDNDNMDTSVPEDQGQPMTSTPNAQGPEDITLLGGTGSPWTRSRRRRHRPFENQTENIPRFELSDESTDNGIPSDQEEEQTMDDSAAANFTIFGSREQNKRRRKRKNNTTSSAEATRPSSFFAPSSSAAPGLSRDPARAAQNLSSPFFMGPQRRPSPPLRPSRRARGPPAASRSRQEEVQLYVPRMPNVNVSV